MLTLDQPHMRLRDDEALTIHEAAAQTGLSVHTLRYYERIGLLNGVPRAANGRRYYTEAEVKRLVLLTRMRATGLSIQQMLQLNALYLQGNDTLAQRRALMEEHRERVLAQIAELERCLELVEYKIDLYTRLEAEREG